MDPKQEDQSPDVQTQQPDPQVIINPNEPTGSSQDSVVAPEQVEEVAQDGMNSNQGFNDQSPTEAPITPVATETPSTEPPATQPVTVASPQTPTIDQSPAPEQPGTIPQTSNDQMITGTVNAQPQAMNPDPEKKMKSKKKLLLLALPILLLVTLIGVFLALKVMGSTIKLTSYDGDVFSVSFPEGYEQKERLGLTYFEETSDANEDTRSGVIVASETIPASLSAEQKQALKQQFEGLGDKFIAEIPNDKQEVKNKETSDTELDGLPAKRVSAELYEGSKKVGDLYITIGSNDDKFALVAVLAHSSDPGVTKEAQKIMDSFKFKTN